MSHATERWIIVATDTESNMRRRATLGEVLLDAARNAKQFRELQRRAVRPHDHE